MAIWFHDAGRRSGAFYDHSQYIPQAWAERKSKERREDKGKIKHRVNKVLCDGNTQHFVWASVLLNNTWKKNYYNKKKCDKWTTDP